MKPETEHRIALVTHSAAGVGRALKVTNEVSALLSIKDIFYQVFKDEWPTHFDGFSMVWIIGGDGTMNQFVNRYPDIQVPIGLLKGGTGNDFHWVLYGGTTVSDQVDLMMLATPVPMDLGTCNEEYFINGIGIGFEGAVACALTGKQKRPGKTSFMVAVLRKILGYRCAEYKIRYDGKQISNRFLLLDLSNGSRAGGGFHVAPVARPNDGFLDLVTVGPLSPWRRIRYLPVIERGKHLQLPFVHHERIRSISIESKKDLQYHCDGEYAEASRLEIGILPGRLRFLCKPLT